MAIGPQGKATDWPKGVKYPAFHADKPDVSRTGPTCQGPAEWAPAQPATKTILARPASTNGGPPSSQRASLAAFRTAGASLNSGAKEREPDHAQDQNGKPGRNREQR